MEDAPGKPDPTGLLVAIEQLEQRHTIEQKTPVFYVGDTVADMYTIQKAKSSYPERTWMAIGILPPHVQENPERHEAYTKILQEAGAALVLSNVQQFTPERLQQLLSEF